MAFLQFVAFFALLLCLYLPQIVVAQFSQDYIVRNVQATPGGALIEALF
jgi:hypothetical protein